MPSLESGALLIIFVAFSFLHAEQCTLSAAIPS